MTLEDGYHDHLFFAYGMERYCGDEVTIIDKADPWNATSDRVWQVSSNTWMWHENWLNRPFLLDEDFDL